MLLLPTTFCCCFTLPPSYLLLTPSVEPIRLAAAYLLLHPPICCSAFYPYMVGPPSSSRLPKHPHTHTRPDADACVVAAMRPILMLRSHPPILMLLMLLCYPANPPSCCRRCCCCTSFPITWFLPIQPPIYIAVASSCSCSAAAAVPGARQLHDQPVPAARGGHAGEPTAQVRAASDAAGTGTAAAAAVAPGRVWGGGPGTTAGGAAESSEAALIGSCRRRRRLLRGSPWRGRLPSHLRLW